MAGHARMRSVRSRPSRSRGAEMTRLREFREQRFMTQKELAAKTGLTVATISRLETGKRRPQFTTVRRLAKSPRRNAPDTRGRRTMTTKRVAIYARVSTEMQEREGTSLESQVARCLDYAREQGWSVERVAEEQGSGGDISGR